MPRTDVASLRTWALASAFWIVAAGAARSAPIVSLDLDPGSPGVQATVTVAKAGDLQVDLLVAGIDVPPLAGFEFELQFDPNVLGLVSVVNGGFLSSPFFFDVFPDDGSVFVQAAIRSFGDGPTGDGVLARLVFDALGVGESVLDLEAVLYRPLGAILPDPTIPTDGVFGGSLKVVPEPSTALLFVLACALALLSRRDPTPSARSL
jgi:hypothetical protein